MPSNRENENKEAQAGQAVFVIGPESSGNRLMRRILVEMGYEGSSDMFQPWDDGLPEDDRSIVWGRSWPHGARGEGRYKPLVEDVDFPLVTKYGIGVYYILLSRNWKATTESQVTAGHVIDQKEALDNVREFWATVPRDLERIGAKWVLVSYEDLIRNPTQAMIPVFDMLGRTPQQIRTVVTDQNNKYF